MLLFTVLFNSSPNLPQAHLIPVVRAIGANRDSSSPDVLLSYLWKPCSASRLALPWAAALGSLLSGFMDAAPQRQWWQLFSPSVMSVSLRPHGPQHIWLPWTSPPPGVCSNSCPLTRWCYPTISSSVVPFSFCLQSFPASGSFPTSRLFTSGGQIIGASASVLPINIPDWFPLVLTGLISLQSKGLSRVFSNTTVQKHQFFSSHLSLWSSSHIRTWLLGKP